MTNFPLASIPATEVRVLQSAMASWEFVIAVRLWLISL